MDHKPLVDVKLYTVAQLKAIAKTRGLKGYSRLTKLNLFLQLNKQAQADPVVDAEGAKDAEEKDDAVAEEKDDAVVAAVAAVNANNKHIPGGKVQKNIPMGLHVFKGKDMIRSIGLAMKTHKSLKTVQIFTHGPRNLARVKLDYDGIRALSDVVSIYVHSSYITNPWGKHGFDHTIDQFDSTQKIGGKGVVLHIPKIKTADVVAPVKQLADILRDKKLRPKIILEMKAVKSHATMSYESPEKINRLCEALAAAGLTPNEAGICIDTAHIYAGGADIRSYAAGIHYLRSLKHHDWICLIHLNGNEYDATKRAGDKHAVPLSKEDFIWKGMKYKDTGCRAFIEYAMHNSIDYILEVKDHHTDEQVNAFIKRVAE
jgi:endonuclease IV